MIRLSIRSVGGKSGERAGLISREAGTTVKILIGAFPASRVVAVHSLVAGGLSDKTRIGRGTWGDVAFRQARYDATFRGARV